MQSPGTCGATQEHTTSEAMPGCVLQGDEASTSASQAMPGMVPRGDEASTSAEHAAESDTLNDGQIQDHGTLSHQGQMDEELPQQREAGNEGMVEGEVGGGAVLSNKRGRDNAQLEGAEEQQETGSQPFSGLAMSVMVKAVANEKFATGALAPFLQCSVEHCAALSAGSVAPAADVRKEPPSLDFLQTEQDQRLWSILQVFPVCSAHKSVQPLPDSGKFTIRCVGLGLPDLAEGFMVPENITRGAVLRLKKVQEVDTCESTMCQQFSESVLVFHCNYEQLQLQ